MSVLERLINKNKEEWFGDDPSEALTANAVPEQPAPAQTAVQPSPENAVNGENPSPQPAPRSGNTEYLKSLGFSPEAIQSLASGYSPAQGGFIEQLYRSTMQNQGAPDENRLAKLRNQNAVIDAFGLVAQLATAAARGNVRERKLSETATGAGIGAERDLRNVYRQLSEQYNKGLINARMEDQKVGYGEYLANRKAITSALQSRYSNEEKLRLEDFKAKSKAEDREARHSETLERDNNRHSNTMAHTEKRNEFTAKQNEMNRSAAWNRTAYAQSQQNARNRYTQDQINARNASGGTSKSGKKTKTVAYPVPAGTGGAEFDGVGYYKKREYTPEQYESLVARAKSEITPAVRKGLGITGNQRLSDSEYLQAYVQLHPELLEDLYDPSSLSPTIDINQIGGAAGLNPEEEEEDEYEEYLIR
jgi:hypothetical protein